MAQNLPNVLAAETNSVTPTNLSARNPSVLTKPGNAAMTNAAPLTAATNDLAARAGVTNAAAPDTNEAPIVALDWKSFDIISSRNIFNPHRTSGRRSTSRPVSPTARSESFTLLGTVSYAKGSFAIFDGTSSSYRKNVKLSDSIAGYKIAEIAPDSVKLAADSNKFITLPVGNQMKRYDGGLWRMAGHVEPSAESSPVASAASSSSSAPAMDPAARTTGRPPIPTSDDVQNEIMKKLMQKRESE